MIEIMYSMSHICCRIITLQYLTLALSCHISGLSEIIYRKYWQYWINTKKLSIIIRNYPDCHDFHVWVWDSTTNPYIFPRFPSFLLCVTRFPVAANGPRVLIFYSPCILDTSALIVLSKNDHGVRTLIIEQILYYRAVNEVSRPDGHPRRAFPTSEFY